MKLKLLSSQFSRTKRKWILFFLLVSFLFIGTLKVISFSSQASLENEVVSIQQVTIHRPSLFTERDLINALPDGVALVANPPENLFLLADAYRKALQKRDNLVSLSGKFSILAVGTLLDSPDQVAVREIVREGNL